MRRPGDDEQLASPMLQAPDRLVAEPAARRYERETLYGAPMPALAPLRRGAGATDRPVDGRARDGEELLELADRVLAGTVARGRR